MEDNEQGRARDYENDEEALRKVKAALNERHKNEKGRAARRRFLAFVCMVLVVGATAYAANFIFRNKGLPFFSSEGSGGGEEEAVTAPPVSEPYVDEAVAPTMPEATDPPAQEQENSPLATEPAAEQTAAPTAPEATDPPTQEREGSALTSALDALAAAFGGGGGTGPVAVPAAVSDTVRGTEFIMTCGKASRGRIAFAVENGADVNARGNNGTTPLMLAVMNNPDRGAVQALIDAGADVNARDGDGMTPLIYAARFRSDTEVLRLLIEAGADANAQDDSGMTPLMAAAAYNLNHDVMTALLETDTKARDNRGNTAVDYARRRASVRHSETFWRITEAQGR